MIPSRSNRWVAKGVGSRRPSATSLRSVGVEAASTRPVVMVMLLIQSVSRCSVAGLPWTPMFATDPPGRTSSQHSSKVSGTPTASITTSAPRPSAIPRPPPPGTPQLAAQLEGLGSPYRFHPHVGAEPVGDLLYLPHRLLGRAVDGHVSAKLPSALQTRVVEVYGDDLARPVEAGRHDGRQPHGAGGGHGPRGGRASR